MKPKSVYRVRVCGGFSRFRFLIGSTLLVLAVSNCEGIIGPGGSDLGPGGGRAGGPGDGGLTAAPLLFSCDPSAVPDELPMPRLTRVQLQNTLQFAVQLALPMEAAAVWAQVQPAFTQYVPDLVTPAPGDVKGGFSRTDQAIEQSQIDAMYQVGVAIGQQLTSSTSRLTALMGSCATDASTANDATCLASFIGSWGSRLLRYPLTADDIAFYAAIAGTTPVDPAAVADVVTALVNAPETLYRVEHGTDASPTSPLSAFELASRLSYQFWQAPPDDTLWNLATSGQLNDPMVYAEQVDRLLQSPNAYQSLDEFITQWMRLNELPPLNVLNGDPVFQAFAGTPLPSDSTHDAMVGDVLYATHHALQSGGTLSDLLKDNRSYATDPFVAGIYGVPVWDGVSEAPVPPSALRAGLLTRPGMLATGTATTRPIHKGYLVRNALLCQQVGSPPPNVNTTPPTSTTTMTTRESVTSRTSGGVCASCHTTLINPPGFITESFDALGRERTTERIFDAQGNVIANLPVDTSAIPAVTPADQRTMKSPGELIAAIDESQLFHSCLVLRYFRFTYERNESLSKDGCALSDMEKLARGGATFSEVLAHLVEAQGYKERRFQ